MIKIALISFLTSAFVFSGILNLTPSGPVALWAGGQTLFLDSTSASENMSALTDEQNNLIPSPQPAPTILPTPTLELALLPILHPTPSPSASPSIEPSPIIESTPTPIPDPTPSGPAAFRASGQSDPIPTPSPTPLPTPTPLPSPAPVPGTQLDELFAKYATGYGVNQDLLKKIAACESGFNSQAANLGYGGLYQYSAGTWASTRSRMNLNGEAELRFNAEESIRTAAFQLATSGPSIWPNCAK